MARAVYATSGRSKLFLGYTTISGDEPQALLIDVMGGMSSARLGLMRTLQATGAMRVRAVGIPSDDRWAHAMEHNSYRHPETGEPFIEDTSLGYVEYLKESGTTEKVTLTPWADLPFELKTGRRQDVSASDGAIPYIDGSGAEDNLEIES